uniref:ORFX n=1 Tax=Cacao swollen shoot virus TaxID=31559 RepID=A0A240FXI8_9VIRU|nr:ORFX [Cacao swollen shoot virus]
MMITMMKSLQNGMKVLMKKDQVRQFGIRKKKKKKMNMIPTSIWLIYKRKKMSGKKSPPAYKKKWKWNIHGGGHRRRQYSLKQLTIHHLVTH